MWVEGACYAPGGVIWARPEAHEQKILGFFFGGRGGQNNIQTPDTLLCTYLIDSTLGSNAGQRTEPSLPHKLVYNHVISRVCQAIYFDWPDLPVLTLVGLAPFCVSFCLTIGPIACFFFFTPLSKLHLIVLPRIVLVSYHRPAAAAAAHTWFQHTQRGKKEKKTNMACSHKTRREGQRCICRVKGQRGVEITAGLLQGGDVISFYSLAQPLHLHLEP